MGEAQSKTGSKGSQSKNARRDQRRYHKQQYNGLTNHYSGPLYRGGRAEHSIRSPFGMGFYNPRQTFYEEQTNPRVMYLPFQDPRYMYPYWPEGDIYTMDEKYLSPEYTPRSSKDKKINSDEHRLYHSPEYTPRSSKDKNVNSDDHSAVYIAKDTDQCNNDTKSFSSPRSNKNEQSDNRHFEASSNAPSSDNRNRVLALERTIKKERERAKKTAENYVSLQQECKRLETERSELMTRLSSLVGSKLTNENSDIADLSDLNRPTKLGEQFSELYDNQWTEAFEDLTSRSKMSDEDACQLLLRIVTALYKECRSRADADLIDLIQAVEKFQGVDQSTEVQKRLKDDRKKHYKIHFNNIEQKLRQAVKEITESITGSHAIGEYVSRCTELCWLMSIQDPPVYMDTNTEHRSGESFNKEMYRVYTMSGPVLDYVVWPVLYLAEGKAMLGKGVAQCKAMLEEDDDPSHD